MEPKKQPPDLALGLRWPHRLLQLFPVSWKRNYLLRKSGGEAGQESFDLCAQLRKSKRFLIVWPERSEELLVAFPAIRVLRETTGGDSVYAHLVPAELTPLIADLFPGEQILSWMREELAWHEPSIQATLGALIAFSPEMTVNLMRPCPTVVKALVKASGAALRMAVDGENARPYANMLVQSEADSPLATHYFQILNSWRYADFVVKEQWPVLQPDPEQRHDAAEAWALSGAAPENTWLYIHDAFNASRPLNDELHAWLQERIQAQDAGEPSIAVVVFNPPDAHPIFREGVWLKTPVLKASSLSEFLSIAGLARGVAAFQGAGLHIASLTDVGCLAFLRREESAYDASTLNKLFTVDWIDV